MDPVEKILEFSKCGSCFGTSDSRSLQRLCEGSKDFLREDGKEFVRMHLDTPMLVATGADTTPLTTTQRRYATFVGKRITRKCKELADFAAARIFLQVPTGEARVVFTEATKVADKSAWSLFTLIRKLFPPLRTLGHRGIEILYFNADRAVFTAGSRHEEQFQVMHFRIESRGGTPRRLMLLKTWSVASACCFHDAMNGLKWGCNQYLGDAECLKNAFISLESLRNGMSTLWTHLPGWLACRLQYRDWSLPLDVKKHVYAFATDNEDVQAELLELELRFEGGMLFVAERFANDPELLTRVAAALQTVWLIEKFTVARWSTVGDSSRLIMLLELTGMKNLIRYCVDSPVAQSYYVQGYLRCDDLVPSLYSIGSP